MPRVLVIEDNPTNLELVSYLLQAHGYEVLEAPDGKEGLEVASRELPDLVLCDIQMPWPDGYEVARRLKSDPATRSIPLLAVTALAMVGDRHRITRAGFDGYIDKPIDPAAFVAQLETYLATGSTAASPRARPSFPSATKNAIRNRLPHGQRVLVVDDLIENILPLRSVLERAGYRVAWAHDVAAAMREIQLRLPDLILCDIHMPGADGFELLRRIKSVPRLRSIPFAFTASTFLSAAQVRRAREFGADALIERPIEDEALIAEVDRLLGQGDA